MRDLGALQEQRSRLLTAIEKELEISPRSTGGQAPTDLSAQRIRALQTQLAETERQIADVSYLNQFIRLHNRVDRRHQARRSLLALYVEPELEARAASLINHNLPPPPSVLSMILAEEPRRNPLTYREVLNEALSPDELSTVFITGEPGIGKTTLLKMIGVRCAERTLQQEDSLSRLPLYVELGRFGRYLRATAGIGKLHDLAAHIALGLQQEFRTSFPEITMEEVLEGLNTGKYLLLLDALDEIVLPALRVRTIGSIREALDLSACPVIVTMRSATYHQTKTYSGHPHKELRRLTVDQMRQYVSQWYDHPLPASAQGLLDELERNERLRQLLSNPLMLYMMVSQLSSQGIRTTRDIPADRVKLYQGFIDHLIKERPEGRFTQEDELAQLIPPLKQHEHLCQIAYEMHEPALWYAPEIMLRSIIERIQPRLSPDEAQRYLLYLEEESGLLQRRSQDHYVFSHFSFQEFFTAEFLANQNREQPRTVTSALLDAIAEATMDPWWHEVIVIYFALSQDEQLIQKLLDDNDNIFATHLLLAVDCLIASNSSPTPQRVEEVLGRLIVHYRRTTYSSLRQRIFKEIVRLGEPTSTLLRFLAEELRQTDRERCQRAITALGRLGTPEAEHLLVTRYRSEGLPNDLILPAITALVRMSSRQAESMILDMLGGDPIIAAHTVNQLLATDHSEYLRLLLSFLNEETFMPSWLSDLLVSQLGSRQEAEVQAYLLNVLRVAFEANDEPRVMQLLSRLEIDATVGPGGDASDLVEYARTLLRSRNDRLVVAALRFLSRQRDPSLVDDLLEQLLDPQISAAVKAESLRTLAAIGGEDAEFVMIEFVRDSPEPLLRREGMALLGRSGSNSSLNYLIEQLTAVMALSQSDPTLSGLLIEAIAKIQKRHAQVLRQDVCSLVIKYLQHDEMFDQSATEAATAFVLQAGSSIEVKQLLDLARKRLDIGYALIMLLLADGCPPNAQNEIRGLLDDYVYKGVMPELVGPAYRLTLKLLESTQARTAAVMQVLDIGADPVQCLEALTFLQQEMVPDTDTLLKVRRLLLSTNTRVVERAIHALTEFGSGDDIPAIHALIHRPEVKQAAFDALFAIANRDRQLGHPLFRRH